MPKSLMITPDEVRKPGQIDFKPIPLNQYNKTITDETKNFSKEDLVGIQRDMAVIRAFESMLNEIKLRGNYKDIPYNHRGPAHLSLGQQLSSGD